MINMHLATYSLDVKSERQQNFFLVYVVFFCEINSFVLTC